MPDGKRGCRNQRKIRHKQREKRRIKIVAKQKKETTRRKRLFVGVLGSSEFREQINDLTQSRGMVIEEGFKITPYDHREFSQLYELLEEGQNMDLLLVDANNPIESSGFEWGEVDELLHSLPRAPKIYVVDGKKRDPLLPINQRYGRIVGRSDNPRTAVDYISSEARRNFQ